MGIKNLLHCGMLTIGLVNMLFPLSIMVLFKNWHSVIKSIEVSQGCVKCELIGFVCMMIWLGIEYLKFKRECAND